MASKRGEKRKQVESEQLKVVQIIKKNSCGNDHLLTEDNHRYRMCKEYIGDALTKSAVPDCIQKSTITTSFLPVKWATTTFLTSGMTTNSMPQKTEAVWNIFVSFQRH